MTYNKQQLPEVPVYKQWAAERAFSWFSGFAQNGLSIPRQFQVPEHVRSLIKTGRPRCLSVHSIFNDKTFWPIQYWALFSALWSSTGTFYWWLDGARWNIYNLYSQNLLLYSAYKATPLPMNLGINIYFLRKSISNNVNIYFWYSFPASL